MGVPKFFRWICERYPLTLQDITPNKIPDYDHLYLDMNGIIHNCVRAEGEEENVPLTEEQIFMTIFKYLETLFNAIKPKKLFYLAVDGAAPRAKMNQQRARRFRSAESAKKVKEGLGPDDPIPFDGNCITPGTEFMARLSTHLRYFLVKKMSEDQNWKRIQVIFSGHEVPGEGEHKIMAYIRDFVAGRSMTAAPTRHCLYGLDADLIILGLISHEPNFSLLREEVRFGGKQQGPSGKFLLMHLSLLRDYLNIEFSRIKTIHPDWTPSFELDFERFLDDFVLFGYFVGNDFLPNLPTFSIKEGALGTLFETYFRLLPELGGFLIEAGTVKLGRLHRFLQELLVHEILFVTEMTGGKVFKPKSKTPLDPMFEQFKNLGIKQSHKDLFAILRDHLINQVPTELHFMKTLSSKDRMVLHKVVEEIGLKSASQGEGAERHLVIPEASGVNPAKALEILNRYDAYFDKMESENNTPAGSEAQTPVAVDESLTNSAQAWMKAYSIEKFGEENMDQIKSHVSFKYVEGLQWVLNYYQKGVCSWSWYFPYHYAPFAKDLVDHAFGLMEPFKASGQSDLFEFLNSYEFQFELGEPFKPFQQLLSVLPPASKDFLPEIYRHLVTDANSPILDYYPETFELDMNLKENDWEAVVKIPFIDQARIMKAIEGLDQRFTSEESLRNAFGKPMVYTSSRTKGLVYPSSFPKLYPDILTNYATVTEYVRPTIAKRDSSRRDLAKRMSPDFPTLKSLQFNSVLREHSVNLFGQSRKTESTVLSVVNPFQGVTALSLAPTAIAAKAFVGWPYLTEARIVGLSSLSHAYSFDHNKSANSLDIVEYNQSESHRSDWIKRARQVDEWYSRRGVLLGEIEILVEVLEFQNMEQSVFGSLAKSFASFEHSTFYPLQLVIPQVEREDPRFLPSEALPLSVLYPRKREVIYVDTLFYKELNRSYFGLLGTVADNSSNVLVVRISVPPKEPATHLAQAALDLHNSTPYLPVNVVSKRLNLSKKALSKISSKCMVQAKAAGAKLVNVGLDLKFEARGLKVEGYTKRSEIGWTYSEAAIRLLEDYVKSFPRFFKNLEAMGDRDEMATEDELFPATEVPFNEGEEGQESLAKVSQWLKASGCRLLRQVSVEQDTFSEDEVKLVEIALDAMTDSLKTYVPIFESYTVSPELVMNPSDADLLLRDQKIRLGDRVTYVSDSGNIPLGLRGVVVGVVGSTDVDVVFDKEIFGGTTLSQRCSPGRGARVKVEHVLDLTTPKSPHSKKTDTIPAYLKYFQANPRKLEIPEKPVRIPREPKNKKPAVVASGSQTAAAVPEDDE